MTVDFDSLDDQSVTVRERDSMRQDASPPTDCAPTSPTSSPGNPRQCRPPHHPSHGEGRVRVFRPSRRPGLLLHPRTPAPGPLRRLGGYLVRPSSRHLSPPASTPTPVSQPDPLGLIVALLIVPFPRLALALFIGTLVLDFLDGELARARGLASNFGALLDQVCDHIRELTVLGGLVAVGALRGEIGVAYAAAYPLANVLLYLADRFRTPCQSALRLGWSITPS